MIHWPKSIVTIAIVEVDARLSERRRSISNFALQNAINEINKAGSGVRLVQSTKGAVPDIEVYLTADTQVGKHALAKSISRALGKRPIGAARIFFEDYKINKALIIIAASDRKREVSSVMLEEVIQSLGLPTDIRNSYYRGRSVFSETGSRVTKIQGQDAKALLQHYPPR